MQPTNEPEDMKPAAMASHNTRRAYRVRGVLSKKEASLKFLQGHRIKVRKVDNHTTIYVYCHRSDAPTLHDAILKKRLFVRNDQQDGVWSRNNTVRAQLRYYDGGPWEKPKRTRKRKDNEENVQP